MNTKTVIAFWLFIAGIIIILFNPVLGIALFCISLLLYQKSSAPAEKDRFAGIKIFGWVEVIVGALGSFVFLASLLVLLATTFGMREAQPGDFGLVPALFFSIPFVPAFLAGVGVIRRKAWGRKINSLGIPIVIALLAACLLVFLILGLIYFILNEPPNLFIIVHYIAFLILDVVIAINLILAFRRFFNSLVVKEYFNLQE
ncbi:MAG: hypothetical protein NC936_00140 [Candidatus Omnitrophica bacterium]|nr:hypothetical protein [Candidatus Omnitrophota bacterium]